ncbi:MAG: MFS transporter [Planctomycetes bacterium]|nr:MFS transporter [Planctomycetota bacterium]
MLALLSITQFLGMSLWMGMTAVTPHLRIAWNLDASSTGWLTTATQLGFVAGTAVFALLNVADVVPARRLFAFCALAGAGVNGALVMVDDYASAFGLRFATGACLAGVYPPAMKMAATWFFRGRGFAIGILIGALVLGKAFPYAAREVAGDRWEMVVLCCSMFAVTAAGLVFAFYRDGPHGFPRRPFSWALVGSVTRDRPTRLAIGGYLGHMWELYAMWIWVPPFIAASLAAWRADGHDVPEWTKNALAFLAIAAGGVGSLWCGRLADRIGRERAVNRALVASGACCLLAGTVFGASPWLLALLIGVWGFFVVADSAQFSTLVTEVAPKHAVGTALTLQTSIGFLLTMVTIQTVPLIEGAASWRWAFPMLALGPVFGVWCMRRLEVLRG